MAALLQLRDIAWSEPLARAISTCAHVREARAMQPIILMAAKKKSGGRKYSKGASKKVEKAMHERKRGTLKSGRSGKTVKSKKQAIAIGLSEARAEGKKVPKKRPSKKRSSKKRSSKKRSSKK